MASVIRAFFQRLGGAVRVMHVQELRIVFGNSPHRAYRLIRDDTLVAT
jgi:hypothetical protein